MVQSDVDTDQPIVTAGGDMSRDSTRDMTGRRMPDNHTLDAEHSERRVYHLMDAHLPAHR